MPLTNVRLFKIFLLPVLFMAFVVVFLFTHKLTAVTNSNLTKSVNDYNTQPYSLNISKVPWLSAPAVPRPITRKEYDTVIEILRTFTGLLERANVSYIMCDGTLLGSYMHHDIIPWDDDLDLMVRYRDLPKVKQIFKQESIWKEYSICGYHDGGKEYSFDTLQKLPPDINDPQYFINSSRMLHKFKFFRKNSTKAGVFQWNWPFIDIKYYLENDTHVWNLDSQKVIIYHQRSNFYPLHLRPFGPLWLLAPRNTRDFLIKKFYQFRCESHFWDHKKEIQQHKKKAPCFELSKYYPFVWRERSNKGVLETLKIDNKIIQRIEVPESFNDSQLPKPFDL